MNFIKFGTAFTNIFPAANSKNGGQLMTEFNIRARESVGTHSSIKYNVGPSYVHSADDFEVRILSDDSGVATSYSSIQIMPGRGVINGHYIETLAPMAIDLLEANAKLKQNAQSPLKGKLAIGIRMFYATEQTVAGTILVENSDEMYQGVQVVILPVDQFITPIDSPEDVSKVTAHLRLATFTFSNNRISGITNLNSEKCQYIVADRIANIDMMLSDSYVRKSGLNSKKIYAFAGKGTDPATGYDTWEDVTDSMIVWDSNPVRTSEKPAESQAEFTRVGGKVVLSVPHRQVEGMVDADNHPEYYATRNLQIPTADYATNTSGVVDSKYTSHIKELYERVEEFRTTVNGKQVIYLDQKDSDTELPAVNQQWEVGDYALVNMDYTADEAADGVRAPSTMYIVLPGLVNEYTYVDQTEGQLLTGACLINLNYYAAEGDARPSTSPTERSTYPVFFDDIDRVRGRVGQDFFTVSYFENDSVTKYYYKVTGAGLKSWSDYVPVTGQVPLAQESVIGGFLNVSPDAADNGYVYRDEYGRLKLIDYQLLRSGTLAYQLGDDITFPTSLTTAEVQSYINEYVNDRVAFPSLNKLNNSANPNILDLFIYLPKEEAPSVVLISNIDSRFNTSVQIHILGNADSNTTVVVKDCQKVKIDNDIAGSPVINVVRSCLYYDPVLFNYIRDCHAADETSTGFYGLTLWYEMIDDSDPNLVIDGMTVSELDAPVVPEDLSYWDVSNANDNHYLTALNSITFNGSGDIVKCGLLLANESTDNVDPGEKIIVGEFNLPQGSGLAYPISCLTKQLKVTGTFVTAYYADNMWYTTDTSFTALTAPYNNYTTSYNGKGTIAFHSKTTLVQAEIGATSIPCWESDTYHLFYGGCIS